MYRGRLWTMRQFAGFGTPSETNERYRFLLEHGQGGLSVAFDMPTLMGLDSDDPRSEGEVGRCGVATDSIDDFETLFEGIPLGDITTSMTISGPATIAFACFLATAERQGVAWDRLDGTLQTDILKEYIAQKEWLFPPRPHLRLIGDLMAFCAARAPKFHPVSVSGYHIREAGATAAQELAFTLADGFAYVELGLQRGLDPAVFVPGLTSSSTVTSTCSRSSASSEPPGASGSAGCASDTACPMPTPGDCASTPRRQGSRTRPSSP
jgi:methylmalonyl-CoA mutase N-terminal domain/subunit